MRPQRGRAAPGGVRAAAAQDARAGQRRLVRGHQGPLLEDHRRGAEQMVPLFPYHVTRSKLIVTLVKISFKPYLYIGQDW